MRKHSTFPKLNGPVWLTALTSRYYRMKTPGTASALSVPCETQVVSTFNRLTALTSVSANLAKIEYFTGKIILRSISEMSITASWTLSQQRIGSLRRIMQTIPGLVDFAANT